MSTQLPAIELVIAKVKFALKRAVSHNNLEAMRPVDRATVGCTPEEGARLRLRRLDRHRWQAVIRPPSEASRPRPGYRGGQAQGAFSQGEGGSGSQGHPQASWRARGPECSDRRIGSRWPTSPEIERWRASKLLAEGASEDINPFYPMASVMFDQCITSRARSALCGASTPDLIRSAVNWIVSKLMMPDVETNSSVFRALRAMAIDQLGKPIREAKPVNTALIKHLELRLEALEDGPRLLCGIFLCVIYASLRFDGQRRVCPGDLAFSEGALRGTAWQTKVERARHGTRFAVPDVSLSGKAPRVAQVVGICPRLVRRLLAAKGGCPAEWKGRDYTGRARRPQPHSPPAQGASGARRREGQ